MNRDKFRIKKNAKRDVALEFETPEAEELYEVSSEHELLTTCIESDCCQENEYSASRFGSG